METRVCTRCLLRDMIEAGDSMEMIEKYRAAIKAADRVTEEVYESRLAVCQDCEKLNAGTCMACGCYVELRAVAAVSRCPKKKWEPQPCRAVRRSGSRRTAVTGETSSQTVVWRIKERERLRMQLREVF